MGEKNRLKLSIHKGCIYLAGINLGGNIQPFEVAYKYQFASIGNSRAIKDRLIKATTLRNPLVHHP